MRSFFQYYGSKWRIAQSAYPGPVWDRVVEPFAGSACYSVKWEVDRADLYDLDEYICAVWDYLIHVNSCEILNLPDLPLDGHVDDLKVAQEAKWLIGYWLNAANTQPCKQPSQWMKARSLSDGISPYWGERIRYRIALNLHKIRRWTITKASYETAELPPTATYFVDPPYQNRGKYYRHGSDSIDYVALSKWCRSLPSQVVVCENAGADWLPFEPVATTTTTKHGQSKEIAWIRG